MENLKLTVIEKVRSQNQEIRKARENYWILRLNPTINKLTTSYMNHNSCILSIFTAICLAVIYSHFILSYHVMNLKFECCSCNQYAPDEDRDGRNVEIINQQSYIGVGPLTITFLLLSTLFQEPTIALVILQAARI